ncbi:hypothetical protein BKA93DRAFT_754621 [Sparassis latifolia]
MPRFVTPAFLFSEENPPPTWEQKFRSQQSHHAIENDELCPPPPSSPDPLYAYPQSPVWKLNVERDNRYIAGWVFTSDLNTSRILMEERLRIPKTARPKVDPYMEDGVMKIDPIPGMVKIILGKAVQLKMMNLQFLRSTHFQTRKARTDALLNSEGTVSVDGSYSLASTVEEGNGLGIFKPAVQATGAAAALSILVGSGPLLCMAGTISEVLCSSLSLII